MPRRSSLRHHDRLNTTDWPDQSVSIRVIRTIRREACMVAGSDHRKQRADRDPLTPSRGVSFRPPSPVRRTSRRPRPIPGRCTLRAGFTPWLRPDGGLMLGTLSQFQSGPVVYRPWILPTKHHENSTPYQRIVAWFRAHRPLLWVEIIATD